MGLNIKLFYDYTNPIYIINLEELQIIVNLKTDQKKNLSLLSSLERGSSAISETMFADVCGSFAVAIFYIELATANICNESQ